MSGPRDFRASNASASDQVEVVGPPAGWSGFVLQHRWSGFVLPLLVYMLAGQLETAPQPSPVASEQGQRQLPLAESEQDPFADDGLDTGVLPPSDSQGGNARWYPIAYTIRIALTVAAMLLVLPVYRQFEFRASWLALAVGLLGAPLWVGLALLQRDYLALPPSIAAWVGAARHGYDPFSELGDSPALLTLFLAVRFTGLVLIVPIIEEFFLRGFLARMVVDADWWKVPIGATSAAALATIVAYAALSHPGELLAAVVWFLLVTLLVARTKNLWHAVLAHATTNLLLGVWVLAAKQFWLW